MPYLNDVFISYKRGRINEQWLNEIFLPFFETYLDNELDHTPQIFIDKTGLTPGVDFGNELFKNLICSKCLVSIWSPPYFRRSEWCIKEFLSMRYKQESYNLNEASLPKTLLWPILFRKIDPIPAAVKNLTYLDYSEYNVVGEAFSKSELYIKFQKQLEADIHSIAEIIDNVPPFNPAWETPEGKTDIVKKLQDYYDNYNDFDNPPMQKPIVWPAK